jgi:REP element-mobilizing transposase RayT
LADDRERRDLVARFAEVVPQVGAVFLVWVLMANHLHAVVRTGAESLSVLVHRIHTGFAARFNRRHGRQGHVFQSRFGSRMIGDEADLIGVIRYVVRNPLEAGIVRNARDLERFEWSAYAALLGLRPSLEFESVSEALAPFGPDEWTARERLRSWIAVDLVSPAGERGDRDLSRLIQDVCACAGVSEADLRAGRRFPAVSKARALVCRRAVRELGLRPRELARILDLSEGAVSQALRRGF